MLRVHEQVGGIYDLGCTCQVSKNVGKIGRDIQRMKGVRMLAVQKILISNNTYVRGRADPFFREDFANASAPIPWLPQQGERLETLMTQSAGTMQGADAQISL